MPLRDATDKRRAAALPLAGQRDAINRYAAEAGAEICNWFIEVELGVDPPRPELAKAAEEAAGMGAKLVIAKVGNLTRSDAVRAALAAAPVEFVCLDRPYVNRETLSTLADAEKYDDVRRRRRAREGLAAAKARGVRLGSSREGHWDDPARARARDAGIRRAAGVAADARVARAKAAYADVEPLVLQMRGRGSSLREIADRLNAAGYTTRRKKGWNAMQVSRVIRRTGEAGAEIMRAAAAAVARSDLFSAPPGAAGGGPLEAGTPPP